MCHKLSYNTALVESMKAIYSVVCMFHKHSRLEFICNFQRKDMRKNYSNPQGQLVLFSLLFLLFSARKCIIMTILSQCMCVRSEIDICGILQFHEIITREIALFSPKGDIKQNSMRLV